MPTPPTCRTCGAAIPDTAPAGECPACLVQVALNQTADASADDDAPPTPVEIQPDFPHLEMLGLVGRGGMGVVYRARQRDLNRVVAVKLLHPRLAADPVFAERFLREAQALARLSHPHIIHVYDVGRAAESIYLVMEFLDGGTLRDRLRTGRLPPADALRLIPQLCDALQYAHDHGIVHRDVKPENVLLDRAGNAKIADFGLAKVEDEAGVTLTAPNARMGTLRYMAPEQWANTAGVDHRADIYALGVLFYEILTGDVPTVQYRPPSAKAGTDPRLDDVVARSLRDEPAERYQQAAEIKSDVERIATTRRRRTSAVVAAVGLVALGIAAVVLWPRRQVHVEAPPKPEPTPTPTAVLTSPDWEWTPPENLGPAVNTEHDEGTPFVAADGLTLLFQSNRPGGLGDNDLWQCRRTSAADPWSEAAPLGPAINSPADDGAPCLSGDGLTLVFVSYRGGETKSDIWLARRPAVDAAWGEPERLPAPVNSETYEFRPWLSRDGLTLTFSSLRPPRERVFICRRATAAEPFGEPVPFGPNSGRLNLGNVSFSADGGVLLCNRFNRAFPGDLLWLARVEAPDDPFRHLKSFGPVVNGPWVDSCPSAAADGRTVYFQSDRDNGRGGHDLWLTRRVPKAKP